MPAEGVRKDRGRRGSCHLGLAIDPYAPSISGWVAPDRFPLAEIIVTLQCNRSKEDDRKGESC